MRADVPLEGTPVFRNLDYKWSWYGLTFSDIPFVAMPGMVTLGSAVLFEFSAMWTFVVVAAAGAGLVALKWRKPDGYLETLIHLALTPRRLSHKERDTILRPFPLDQELRLR